MCAYACICMCMRVCLVLRLPVFSLSIGLHYLFIRVSVYSYVYKSVCSCVCMHSTLPVSICLSVCMHIIWFVCGCIVLSVFALSIPPLFISAQGPRLVIVVLRWISNAILGAPETVVAAVFLLSSFPAGQTHLLRVQTRETYTVRIDQRTHVLVIFLRTNATRPSHYLCGLVMART